MGMIQSVNYATGKRFSVKFTFPEMKWPGYPRRALIYFEDMESGYILGIERFGRGIPSSKFYYHINKTPGNMPN